MEQKIGGNNLLRIIKNGYTQMKGHVPFGGVAGDGQSHLLAPLWWTGCRSELR